MTSYEHPGDGSLCTNPACGECAQQRMEAGYRGTAPSPSTCPNCGHNLEEVSQVRVTETTEAKTADKPYGDVEYADPGLQDDGKKRYPLNTEKRVRSAWSYINMAKNAAQYKPADWKKVRARIKAAMKKLDIPVSENSISESATEALINGKRSFDDLRELVRKAVRTRLSNELDAYCWVYIVDISDTDVVYMAEGDKLYQCAWSLQGDDVELGESVAVERTYAPLQSGDMEETATEAVTESRTMVDANGARLIEAKGTDDKGNRVFRVQVIAYGDSKNGRRYPENVMRAAAPLYEGAKAFNRHRTDAEMRSGTIEGLVGYYRNASAGDSGIEADLHVLPSAAAVAEAFDAALALETDEPLIGISHDVYAKFRPVQENGRQIQEATEISSVNSADVVAHPAAGGKATRVVAGGLEDTPSDMSSVGESTEEPDVKPTLADVLAALKEATDEDLAAAGFARASEQNTEIEKKTEEAVKPEAPVKTTETTLDKGSFLGKLMVQQKVEEAELPKPFVESITASLPDQFTESQVDAQISAVKAALAITERAGLASAVAKTTVTKESFDKKKDALDAFFAKDYAAGYHSYREAVLDFTGLRPRTYDEDINRLIMQETVGAYDSSNKRASESMDTTSWAQVLGDSITRRMIKEYAQPSLQSWQAIISSKVPVNDFRTQRVGRVGGYGTLPVVNEAAPYQPLTSPPDEEATYALSKKGGTEDITLEMIANDDVRAIQNIPAKLGLTAAQTLFRFVWDILDSNTTTTTYDGVALFHASHANTASTALSQSSLTAARAAMRNQAAYGDSSNILSLTPKILVVVNDLEELAFQLCTSAVAVPGTPAGPSDTPNLHQGLTPIVVDYWTSTTKWIAVADPTMCPTIELGFYQGRELPELFTQSDPNAGSAFSADKTTFKIRHIYSGTVLDHRGMYRGNS